MHAKPFYALRNMTQIGSSLQSLLDQATTPASDSRVSPTSMLTGAEKQASWSKDLLTDVATIKPDPKADRTSELKAAPAQGQQARLSLDATPSQS